MANLKIALVGKPNSGKTALFNALTGSRQKVANYSGVTVEKKHGYLITPKATSCTIVDLPGTYSLRARSPDEQVTRDVLLNQFNEEQDIDLILTVMDATNLSACIRLALELKLIGKPMLVAMNMSDIAKLRGFDYDLIKMEQLLGIPIIETTAIKKIGIDKLVAKIDEIKNLPHGENIWQESNREMIRDYHKQAFEIIQKCEKKLGLPSLWSQKIDNILLNPIFGIIILLAILFLMFQSVFSWAALPQNLLQNVFDKAQAYVLSFAPHSLIIGLIANGIIAGVGSIIVFLPQILTISLFIIILEDTGYMARAAFLMDKLMGGIGLHGRAFIPLLSSFACAIPGIMATRTIENDKDRLVTILISPLMTCSARLPIYTLMISAFIPPKTIWGFANLQGLVMFILYASGIIFGLIIAFIFKKFILKGKRQPLLLELPSYKLPNWYNVLIELSKPAKAFLRRAGTIILAIMIIIWFLCTFPTAPAHALLPAIDYSFAGMLGKFLQPLFAPIGFNWQIVVALIPGMAAREVAVSTLATIFAIGGGDEAIQTGLIHLLHNSWTIATGLSLITWYIFAPQCMSTLAVAKRETNSWKWPIIMFVYQIALAYIMSYIVFNLTSIFLK